MRPEKPASTRTPWDDLRRDADAEHEVLALVRVAARERLLADGVAVHDPERIVHELVAAEDADAEVVGVGHELVRHRRALEERPRDVELGDLEAEGREDETRRDHHERLARRLLCEVGREDIGRAGRPLERDLGVPRAHLRPVDGVGVELEGAVDQALVALEADACPAEQEAILVERRARRRIDLVLRRLAEGHPVDVNVAADDDRRRSGPQRAAVGVGARRGCRCRRQWCRRNGLGLRDPRFELRERALLRFDGGAKPSELVGRGRGRRRAAASVSPAPARRARGAGAPATTRREPFTRALYTLTATEEDRRRVGGAATSDSW